MLAGCNLVDVGLETSVQRMVKSQQEIDVIKLGAATADVGGAACYQALASGGEGTMEWQAILFNISYFIFSHSQNNMRFLIAIEQAYIDRI